MPKFQEPKFFNSVKEYYKHLEKTGEVMILFGDEEDQIEVEKTKIKNKYKMIQQLIKEIL